MSKFGPLCGHYPLQTGGRSGGTRERRPNPRQPAGLVPAPTGPATPPEGTSSAREDPRNLGVNLNGGFGGRRWGNSCPPTTLLLVPCSEFIAFQESGLFKIGTPMAVLHGRSYP